VPAVKSVGKKSGHKLVNHMETMKENRSQLSATGAQPFTEGWWSK